MLAAKGVVGVRRLLLINTFQDYINGGESLGVSQILGRFSAIEITRFFLHGLFVVFPLTLFPIISDAIGLPGLVAVVIFAGLLMYVLPVDRFSNSFKLYSSGFDENLRKLIWGDDDKMSQYSRSVYDVLFYDKLPEPLRYRIHFLVSLYYLYSRIAVAGLFYAIVFAGLFVSSFVPNLATNISSLFGEAMTVAMLKFGILAVIEGVTVVYSWSYANKVIDSVTRLETVVSRFYAKELQDVSKALGQQIRADL